VRVLGFRVAFAKGDTVWLEAGGDLLGLSRGDATPGVAHAAQHFGFMVDARADVDAWCAQLRAHGVACEKGPYDRSDGRSLYFRDPDAHLLEIFSRPRLPDSKVSKLRRPAIGTRHGRWCRAARAPRVPGRRRELRADGVAVPHARAARASARGFVPAAGNACVGNRGQRPRSSTCSPGRRRSHLARARPGHALK
jgi:hypothetical protein